MRFPVAVHATKPTPTPAPATTGDTPSKSITVPNKGYFLTLPGILKLCQVILGIGCVAIAVNDYLNYNHTRYTAARMTYLMMVTTFTIASFIQLVSFIPSGHIVLKNFHEIIYNLIAFGSQAIVSVVLITSLQAITYRGRNSKRYNVNNKYNHSGLQAEAIIGIVNAIMYFLSAVLAFKSYRRN